MRIRLALSLLLLCASLLAQSSSSNSNATVPRLIRFSGTLTANPPSRTAGVTFALYSQQTGGSPVWSEVQNVKLDNAGRYTVLLGSTKSEGLPVELFTSGEAQWLGVRAEGQAEQARVLMVSVPYALRAVEADTIAGHAITDFVTSENLSNAVREQLQLSTSEGAFNVRNDSGVKTNAASAGATNFADTTTNQVVLVTQNGTGSGLVASATSGYALKASSTTGGGLYVTAGGNAAINAYNTATTGTAYGILGSTASPSGVGFRGRATATTGASSGVMGDSASPSGTGVYGNDSATTGAGTGVMGRSAGDTGVGVKALSVSTTGATTGVRSTVSSASGTSLVLQNTASGKLLSAQVGPANTEVASINGAGDIVTSGKLNVEGAATFSSPITFATGQTFPGAAVQVSVPITGNGAPSSPIALPPATSSAAGYLSATDWTTFNGKLDPNGTGAGLTSVNAFTLGGLGPAAFAKVGAANVFAGDQSITGNLTASKVATATSFNLLNGTTSVPFAFGSAPNNDAFLGFAGNSNSTLTGFGNTGVGSLALVRTTSGKDNVAVGLNALVYDATGNSNTAVGVDALEAITSSSFNTAIGVDALAQLTSGSENVAVGDAALLNQTSGDSNTAVGAYALEGAIDIGGTGVQNSAFGEGALSWITTGTGNTAVGFGTLPTNQSGSYNVAVGYRANVGADGLSNATAIGPYAVTGISNAIVLGCIAEQNGCPASVKVGIGTTAPTANLEVNGTAKFDGTVTFASTPSLSVVANAPLIGVGTRGGPLAIPQSNASTSGFLSSTDWTTFNGKLDPKGTGSGLTAVNAVSLGGFAASLFPKIGYTNFGSIVFQSAGSTPAITATNTTSGTALLAAANGTNELLVDSTGVTIDPADNNAGKNSGTFWPALRFGKSSGEAIVSNRAATAPNQFGLDFYAGWYPQLSITPSGKVGILTQAPSANLEVNGTAKFDGAVTFVVPPSAAVLTSAPLTGNGTTSSKLGITQANSSTDGYLGHADWNTFNGKLDPHGDGSGLSNVAAVKLGNYTASAYPVMSSTNLGSLWMSTSGTSTWAVEGVAANDIGSSIGVYGVASSPNGAGVYAANTSNTGTAFIAATGGGGAMVVDWTGTTIDPDGRNAGITTANFWPALRFGSSSGEGIASNRANTAPNQFGLDFITNWLPRISVGQSGNVGIGTQAPAVPLDVAGNVHTNGLVRMGNETGTTEPPAINGGTYSGLEVRRISSKISTDGTVVAMTDNLTILRDGTNGGLKFAWTAPPTAESISCTGTTYNGSTASPLGIYLAAPQGSTGSTTLVSAAQSVVLLVCVMGDTFNAGQTTEVRIARRYGDVKWVGSLTSTYNQ